MSLQLSAQSLALTTAQPPPTDGSAGIAKTYLSVTEDICTIINPVLGLTGAVTAVLTQGPKTGTAGCCRIYLGLFLWNQNADMYQISRCSRSLDAG
jgi:hypothetical protein